MDFLKQHLNNATQYLEAKSATKKRGNKTTESAEPVAKKQKVNHMIAAKKAVLEEEKKRGHHLTNSFSYTLSLYLYHAIIYHVQSLTYSHIAIIHPFIQQRSGNHENAFLNHSKEEEQKTNETIDGNYSFDEKK